MVSANGLQASVEAFEGFLEHVPVGFPVRGDFDEDEAGACVASSRLHDPGI